LRRRAQFPPLGDGRCRCAFRADELRARLLGVLVVLALCHMCSWSKTSGLLGGTRVLWSILRCVAPWSMNRLEHCIRHRRAIAAGEGRGAYRRKGRRILPLKGSHGVSRIKGSAGATSHSMYGVRAGCCMSELRHGGITDVLMPYSKSFCPQKTSARHVGTSTEFFLAS